MEHVNEKPQRKENREMPWQFTGMAWIALFGIFNQSVSAPPLEEMPTRLEPNQAIDPATVRQAGKGIRANRAGWIFLAIQGEPYERGFQHGTLLAEEITDFINTIAKNRSSADPSSAWQANRLLVNALFLRRYESEFLEEMKGIADGAARAGAKVFGEPIDLLDIACLNSEIESDFLDSAMLATPNGLEGKKFPDVNVSRTLAQTTDHCSAFAATGPATVDGKILFGHITMWTLAQVNHFNVWVDLTPARGNRIVMQTFPGGIMSGLDYYITSGGLLITETTIKQTPFNPDGKSIVSRIRKVAQYANSIDEAVTILTAGNNGMYSNEWMLGDINTNEIALFELGTQRQQLWRSSKDQWVGGTRGFYWGCNNAKDMGVRLETVPSPIGKPANIALCPRDRDQCWLRLFDQNNGKMSLEFGFQAFSTPPLVGFPSCDAKFTTTELAKQLKSWALFGPPLGRTWEARYDRPVERPLVPNDWILYSPTWVAGAAEARATAVDREPRPSRQVDVVGEVPPSWRGTLLPENGPDTWLAAAFADFEKYVSIDTYFRKSSKTGELSDNQKRYLDVLSFSHRTRFHHALQVAGQDVPTNSQSFNWRSDTWYHLSVAKGMMLLSEMRNALGAEIFDRAMDDFGIRHAGKPVSTSTFRAWFDKIEPKRLTPLFSRWLEQTVTSEAVGGGWSVDSFEYEPELALIVYGTLSEGPANSEAATKWQKKIVRRWVNRRIPIKADRDVTDAELKTRHILLVGRPSTNRITREWVKAFPLEFGSESVRVADEWFSHPRTAALAAGVNPCNPRFSTVVLAGISAAGTWHAVDKIPDRGGAPAPVWLMERGESPLPLVVGTTNQLPAPIHGK